MISETKSGLIIILILTFLLWLFAVPSGSVIGNTLAGAIMLIVLACYMSIK